jgi:hypothetical protein
MPKSTEKDDKSQVKAFRKAARELGCEDNEEQFRDALRVVAKRKPQGNNKVRRGKNS